MLQFLNQRALQLYNYKNDEKHIKHLMSVWLDVALLHLFIVLSLMVFKVSVMCLLQDYVSEQNQAEGQTDQCDAGEEDQSRDRGKTLCWETVGWASGSETGGGGQHGTQSVK